MNFGKFTIIYGHYGCGKTNLSINIAIYLAKQGKKVTVVDLDIVNPYFRTSDYTQLLQENGIKVIAPNFAGSTVDLPSLPSEIYSVFEMEDTYVILDVGGDDVGAYALGRFAPKVNAKQDYNAYYVVNKFRSQTQTPENALEILQEIERASRIKATGVINNSHLQQFTTEKHILSSIEYAESVANALKLPLVATTAPKSILDKVENKVENIFPVDVYVKPPF